MSSTRRALRLPLPALALALVLGLGGRPLSAATYLPMSDADLAAASPVIVRATVVSRTFRLESVGGVDRPFTLVTLQRLETLKGAIGETFDVRLAGGKVGDVLRWVPGSPVFSPGQEVILMLAGVSGRPGTYRLSEFGLSKFDLVTDESGRRFAVRPVFGAREDLAVSKREGLVPASPGATPPARDAGSFLAALRAAGRGEVVSDVAWAAPAGPFEQAEARRPHWVNIGGREPGDCGTVPCLFRWFWSTGVSPTANVVVTGTQSNLSGDDAAGCNRNSTCDVQNAIDGWHGIAGTDIRVAGIAGSGNVIVHLDADQDHDGGSAWTTPVGCEGGTVGLGGPGPGGGPRAYRGDTTYYAPESGEVSMRRNTCGFGYSERTFKTAVMHEIGHVLGLSHPNREESTHSTTTPAQWEEAVMRSQVPDAKPSSPQDDDIEAMQYLYTTGSLGTAPGADFAFSPGSPSAGSPVTFTDSSTGAPFSWTWNFGDPASGASNTSTQQSPAHVFSAPGTYTVGLSAANADGTGTVTKTVTVGAGTGGCVPSATTLCLNDGRFQVTAAWRTRAGATGLGTGVQLTGDSGYFWFFNSANIEVITKVLNACTLNPPRFWVFSAGLTNVEVTLTVTDTQNGTVKPYFNPLETAYQPVQDTSAFATCP